MHVDFYLVIGHLKTNWEENVPFIAFETKSDSEAFAKCKELNTSDPLNEYKVETWTKVR